VTQVDSQAEGKMETGQLRSQTLSEYLRELDERTRCNTAVPRQNVGAYEPTRNRGGRSGQSLRKVLEELHGNSGENGDGANIGTVISAEVPAALEERYGSAVQEREFQYG
jgi:hypothetical protein